jgi:hypothetical protein
MSWLPKLQSMNVSFIFFGDYRGAHPPPAGHTQLSRVKPTAGGGRQSLTDEGRLTHPISGGAQRLDQKLVGLEPTHLLGATASSCTHPTVKISPALLTLATHSELSGHNAFHRKHSITHRVSVHAATICTPHTILLRLPKSKPELLRHSPPFALLPVPTCCCCRPPSMHSDCTCHWFG